MASFIPAPVKDVFTWANTKLSDAESYVVAEWMRGEAPVGVTAAVLCCGPGAQRLRRVAASSGLWGGRRTATRRRWGGAVCLHHDQTSNTPYHRLDARGHDRSE